MGMKILNLKFYLDMFVHHQYIRVEKVSDFFDSARLFTVTS
jgi:hypothetical protein